MNLKEAFRYQKFLDTLMYQATHSIRTPEHCILIKKEHLKSAVNQEEEDVTETVEVEPFVSNDIVIQFINWLIKQKEELSAAIGRAKRDAPVDIDAMIEANKYRQQAANAIKWMLSQKPPRRQEHGTGYKFNAEGNQTSYYYNVNVTGEELFDRAAGKHQLRDLLFRSEEISNEVDAYMTNVTVDYHPAYNPNESYEDVIAEFAEPII